MNQIAKINELVVYSVSQAAIAEMRALCLPMVVKDINDKVGYEACKKARIEVKGYRVAVDKQRAEFKKDAIEYGRMVEAKANAIIVPLKEIETHLQAQQDVIDEAKKRAEEQERRIAKERLDSRLAEVQKYNVPYHISEIDSMDDEDFSAFISFARDKFFADQKKREEESARLAKLEEESKEHNAKLQKQQEENVRLQNKIIEQQQAELAERRRVEHNAIEEKRMLEKKAFDEKLEREMREREARIRIADEKLFEEIKAKFPTIELAWTEIARLYNQE